MQFLSIFAALCFVHTFAPSSCFPFYPNNSAFGILAAIAVPLDLPNRNVFISYNFEANYNLPVRWYIPPNVEGFEDDDDLFGSSRHFEPAEQCENCTATTTFETSSNFSSTTAAPKTAKDNDQRATHRQRRSLLSRTHFYYILQDKFEKSGYPGEACLLRLICETNASELGDVNGVLGSIVHVLFSPSTSMHEQLPLAYYQAEQDGVHDQCEQHYHAACQESILDLISAPLHEIIDSLVVENKINAM